MQLILMRHGEPVRDGVDPRDPELCPVGLAQARNAAPYLRRIGIDAIYSSPQLRARQTAAVVCAGMVSDVVLDDGLVEFDHGAPYVHYDGGSAPVWRNYLAGDLSPWGLTAAAFKARVDRAMDGLAAGRSADAKVLAVCHGGVINAWTCGLMGLEQRLQVFEPDYASISRYVRHASGAWAVLSLNELPPICEDISERISTNK